MKAINLSTHCTHTTLAGRATTKVLSWFGENGRLVVLLKLPGFISGGLVVEISLFTICFGLVFPVWWNL